MGKPFGGNGHILGDSAYPNLSLLLMPFRDNGHLTPVQKQYNNVHASICCSVERAFGLLEARFTRLQNIYQNDILRIFRTIITGCVLHNICIMNNDEIQDILKEDPVPQDFPNVLFWALS